MKPTLLALLCALLVGTDGAAAPEPGPVAAWGGYWSQSRTASVRVHHEIGQPIAADRLRALEASVQRLGARLGLASDDLADLRRHPIEYLYVGDASQLRRFGVEDVDGMALVGERRILAARLPHEHELVHVLAYLAIAPAPVSNQPWLQEGLASYLGGHLGEAPAAVLATGDQVLDSNPGLLPGLMTVEGFRESSLPSSSCYAASARFVEFLDLDRGGRGPLLELLRLLAGQEEEVPRRPASIVETQLEGVYSVPFSQLLEDFHEWRRDHPPSGIVPARAPSRPPDLLLADGDHELRWWIDEAGWILAATPLRDRVDLAVTWGGGSAATQTWTAPVRATGFELRMDERGGLLLAHESPEVLLRWSTRPGGPNGSGPQTWYLPAEALGPVQPPGEGRRPALWSQPHFQVD